MKKVAVEVNGKILWQRASLAQYPWERMKGLLGKASISREELLILPKTNSIHMFFMRFPIDVVYLNRCKQVLKVVHDLRPGQMSGCLKAFYALEMKTACAVEYNIMPGQNFFWDEKAQATIEYVLIIAVFLLGVIAVLPPLTNAFQLYASRLLFFMTDI
jgi:uncharacterized protein